MKTAVAISLSQLSTGASFREITLQLLEIQSGIFLEKASIEKDISRLKKAEIAAQESTKKRRLWERPNLNKQLQHYNVSLSF